MDGRAGGGPACWAATRLGGRETKLVYLKLDAILNTVQGSLVPDMTYNVFGGTLNPAQSNPKPYTLTYPQKPKGKGNYTPYANYSRSNSTDSTMEFPRSITAIWFHCIRTCID